MSAYYRSRAAVGTLISFGAALGVSCTAESTSQNRMKLLSLLPKIEKELGLKLSRLKAEIETTRSDQPLDADLIISAIRRDLGLPTDTKL